MRSFQSFRGLGESVPILPASTTTKPPPIVDALPAVLKVGQGLLSSDDAYENAGVIQAKIENLKRMRSRVSGIPLLADFYTNEINKLQAKLVAAKRQTSIQLESEQATRDWRVLGYVIGAGVAIVAISASARLLRRS